jgi:preprotein translocase subunit SecA
MGLRHRARGRQARGKGLGQRHFDVQLIGGMVLHEGDIAEMKHRRRQDAGRHAARLSQRARRQGRPCRHRQRLSRPRDAEWMGQIYNFLGLTVGIIVHGLDDESARRPMPATSPTAPTTSSASTICATT